MKLLTCYIVLNAVADTVAAFLCLAIEKVVPWLSMPTFLVLFFVLLWATWIAAVKLTEPKTEASSALGATGDQRA